MAVSVDTRTLSHLTLSELNQLLEDDSKLGQMAQEMEETQSVQLNKEMTLAGNRSLAEKNLLYQPRLENLKASLTQKYQELQSVMEAHQLKKTKLDKQSVNASLETLLALLQAEGAKIEEETENMAENFLDGGIQLDSFIDEYLSKRKLAHLRRVKIEKLQEMVMKGQRLPTVSMQPQQRPEVTQSPQVQYPSSFNTPPAVMPRRAVPPPPASQPGMYPTPFAMAAQQPASGLPYAASPYPLLPSRDGYQPSNPMPQPGYPAPYPQHHCQVLPDGWTKVIPMADTVDKSLQVRLPELNQLLEDDSKLGQMAQEMEETQSVQLNKEMTLAGNRSLAEKNLLYQPRLENLKASLTQKYQELQSVMEAHQLKKTKLDKQSVNASLETLLALLQAEGAKIEEETENMAENFLDGGIQLDSFIDEYLSKRKLAHLRRVKIEKLQEMVMKGQRLPTVSMQPQQRPEVTQSPQVQYPSSFNTPPAVMPRRAVPPPPASQPGMYPTPFAMAAQQPASGLPYAASPYPLLPSRDGYQPSNPMPQPGYPAPYPQQYPQQYPPAIPQRPAPRLPPNAGFILQ
ncbi:vacuolar sorting-associated 37B [Pelobates cultripes]|uniref:Vacuolar sorting-associated 37B n=1 Tax=Pelobates cultripes TaxID=61616 RepID=A0AAD1SAS5_PELCU|nr:vacuolar sorting-associated 37B [Pelobates cultripes]